MGGEEEEEEEKERVEVTKKISSVFDDGEPFIIFTRLLCRYARPHRVAKKILDVLFLF